MNTIMNNKTGTNAMTDQVIASDLLIAAKSGIKNYEPHSPRQQLQRSETYCAIN